MKLLFLTSHLLYGRKLLEINSTYRAEIAGRHPCVVIGGPGLGYHLEYPIYLPEYIQDHHADCDVVFLADPWHDYWGLCRDHSACPPLYTGIDDLSIPVVMESGDSQFYYSEIVRHLQISARRAVCIRAMSHLWRFDPDTDPIHVGLNHNVQELPPPDLNVPVFYLPHGAYDEMVDASKDMPKVFDVLFSGSDYAISYPARARIADALRSAPDIKTYWLPHPSDKRHEIIGPPFWQLMASARIGVAGTNMYRNLTMRYSEIPACGTLAIGDLPVPEHEMDDWAAHMIDIGDLSKDQILEQIRYWLRHSEDLVHRTHSAREFVLTRHKFSHEWARVMKEIEQWIST